MQQEIPKKVIRRAIWKVVRRMLIQFILWILVIALCLAFLAFLIGYFTYLNDTQ